MSKKYIAYGSNMNLKQMAQRCPTAERIMTGKVKGYELQFRGDLHNAFATIEPNEDSQVDVLLWDIKDQDEKSLDMYEGYPRFYDKQTIPVFLEDGSQTKAMVYVMNLEYKLGLPSIRYFKTIAEGYFDNGLELQPLINAVAGTYQAIIEQELEPVQQMEM